MSQESPKRVTLWTSRKLRYMSMERYDIAIIGTGPAGVSAAITAKVRNKNILLLGSEHLSDKVAKAHRILNYPGLPDISGEALAGNLLKHLTALKISITGQKVNAVYAMGDYFALQTQEEMYEAQTVILACGMSQEKSLEGEQEFLGRDVSYCVTCDAQFYRNKKAAIVSYHQEGEEEAEFLSEIADKVYYFPMYKEDVKLSDKVEVVREKPVKVESISDTGSAVQIPHEQDINQMTGAQRSSRIARDQVTGLRTDAGFYPVDGVFIIKNSLPADQLVPGLEMKENHVAVNAQMETNIPGCFACGDITGKPYQYIRAAGQGNVAALAAVSYLAHL